MEVNTQELNFILTAINCYFMCNFEPQCMEMQEEATKEKQQMTALRDRIKEVLGVNMEEKVKE